MHFLFFVEITLHDIYLIGAGIVAGVVLLGGLAKAFTSINTAFWSPLYDKVLSPWLNRRKRKKQLLETLEDLKVQVSEIVAEVKPNGGGSLKDAVGRIEKHLDYANAKFRFMDDTSPEAIFEADEEFNFTRANRTMCELLDVDEAELLQRRWVACIHGADQQRVLDEWRTARENKCPMNSVFAMVAGPRKTIRVRIQATPRLNRRGELRGFIGKLDVEP